jgi:hypothetical protein
MNSRRYFGAFAIVLFSTVATAGPAPKTIEPETHADKFDVRRGAVVTSSTPVSASLAESMFGALSNGPEPHVTFFADSAPGWIDFVEWSTPSPITLDGFNLRASSDVPTLPDQRAFDHFTLKAKVGDQFVTLYDTDMTVPYPLVQSDNLAISSATTQAVVASEFRAEFRHYLQGNAPGPRIYELDGFGSEECADANYSDTVTTSDALIALRQSVGTGLCLVCICDVDDTKVVVATDALIILRYSVGIGSTPVCGTLCYAGQDE